jgi:hypothetical protein
MCESFCLGNTHVPQLKKTHPTNTKRESLLSRSRNPKLCHFPIADRPRKTTTFVFELASPFADRNTVHQHSEKSGWTEGDCQFRRSRRNVLRVYIPTWTRPLCDHSRQRRKWRPSRLPSRQPHHTSMTFWSHHLYKGTFTV